MAKGMATVIGRRKMCRAHAGDQALPVIMYMAFGDGGVDSSGAVIEPAGDETALRHELMRKEIEGHRYVNEDETTCRYRVRLAQSELACQSISEQGLYDSDGDLVGYKTFLPKGKDGDMEFIFDMDEIF